MLDNTAGGITAGSTTFRVQSGTLEGIGASPRHKSGVAVRFPRMLRLRPDKPLHEADTLAQLKALAQGLRAEGDGAGTGEEAVEPA